MFVSRSRFPSLFSATLLAMALLPAHADDRPAALQMLERQGLTIAQEFDVGGGLRAFAAAAGDRPVAVYLTVDGNVIVGTRLDANGAALDEATLQRLVAKPISDKVWAQLEAATWVQDGSADAPRVVYTFSDPNCPFCNRFWKAARPWVDTGKVQLRHVMVGILKADSQAKAAAILDAADPSAALQQNEQAFGRGGIAPAKRISDKARTALEDNQMLMMSLGFRGTPAILVRDSEGLVQKYNGMPQPAALAEIMGPR